MTTMINDMDVFNSTRALLSENIDLNDCAAVERVLVNPYKDTPLSKRFVDWCIKTAKANKATGGLEDISFGQAGFMPTE